MTLICLVLIASSLLAPQAPSSPQPASEWVHIDGKKNPEMIPQWSAWDTTLRAFRDIGDRFPTEFYRHFSLGEFDELKAAVNAHRDTVDPCIARGDRELRDLAKTEKKVEVLNERMQAINLGCRRKILRIRDELLEKLRPEARFALDQFIEGPVKASISVTVAKREYAFYMKPE